LEGAEARLVELLDGVARRLGATPEIFGYSGAHVLPLSWPKDLAAPEDEGIFGAQPGLKSLALLL
jgi:hypothetical protein